MKKNIIFGVLIVLFLLAGCNEARDKAQSTAVIADLRDLNQTVEMFYHEHMKYPATIQEIKEYSPDLDLEASDGGTFEYDAATHLFVHKPKE